jgi:diguanylate cyclase (GGDEF)-like protein
MFQHIFGALCRASAAAWNPSGSLSARMRLEMRILIGRWLAIVFVGAALALHPDVGVPVGFAYAILVVAFAYTLVLRRLIANGHRAVEDGTLPASGDVLLCAVMLPMMGGFVFPFYAILYLVTLSAGIRLGFQRGMLLAVSIAALDAASRFLDGGSILDTAYVIRTGVLLAIVPITSFLHDEAQKAETDLGQRLRQSEVLNERLQHQTLHDQLTGLPNRALLLKRVTEALRVDGSSQALLVIGVARFNEVNDTFGHDYGDLLLQQIAARLSTTIDAAGTIARVGGEQFAVWLSEAGVESAERAAQRIQRTLSETFTIADDCTLAVSVSVGVALHPEHGTDADLLLRRADIAMSDARRRDLGYTV